MPDSFLQKVMSYLSGGAWRITLQRDQERFILATFRGRRPVSVAHLMEEFPSVYVIVPFLTIHGATADVLPIFLARVRDVLHQCASNSLEVKVSPEAEAFQAVSTPTDFRVVYVWSSARQQIERTMPHGTQYWGSGWFGADNRGWRIADLTQADEAWLRQPVIVGPEILEFLRATVPSWADRRLPFTCPVKLASQAALSLTVRYACEEYIDLNVVWRASTQSAAAIPSLPGYICADDVIWPGIAPQALAGRVPLISDGFRLIGQEIPVFLRDTLPQVKPWVEGGTESIERHHRLLSGPAYLRLTIGPDASQGIGRLSGRVTLVCDGISADAEAISRQLDAQAEFVRLPGSWMPAEIARRAGLGPMGRLADGTPLAKLASPNLSPSETLARSSGRLNGPWAAPEFQEMAMPNGPTAQDTARQHLDLLAAWGIPGGIIGSIEVYGETLASFLAELRAHHADAHILVVGARRALDSLAVHGTSLPTTRFDGNQHDNTSSKIPPGLVTATPKALESRPILQKTSWQLLCLLEADALIKSENSALFRSMTACSRGLVLGLFESDGFLSRAGALAALARVFKQDSADVWRFGLRDLRLAAPPPPSTAVSPKQPSLPQDRGPAQPVEIAIAARASPVASVPIPPRAPVPVQAQTLPTTMTQAGVRVGMRASTGDDDFVREARRLVNARGSRTQFIPFRCYWPTYSSMTAEQRRWYMYWRGQVREGKYPDTDLSYIFLHVYELINNVGVKSAEDGYERLHQLWLAYRPRFPQLDRYLVDWLADYAIVNHCAANPMQLYAEAQQLGARAGSADLAILGCSDRPLSQWPLALIESISNYQFRRSKFYLAGHQDEVEQQIRQGLTRIEERFKSTQRHGILGLFMPSSAETITRQAFQSARYCGSVRTVTFQHIRPYSVHIPLREFVGDVIKHIENRLREQAGYAGRLRGYTLDPGIQRIIDGTFFTDETSLGPQGALAPRQVLIDMDRVKDLTQQSDQLRDILLANEVGSEQPTGTPQTLEQATPNSQGGAIPPKGAPDGVLLELQQVQALLVHLNGGERNFLRALQEQGWSSTEATLREQLPDLLLAAAADHVNQLALAALGDILVATDGDRLIVADDYRDELEHLLSGEGEATVQVETVLRNTTGLPDEWAMFAAQLADHQLAVLEAVLRQADPRATIREIADANATMSGALVDSINEIAYETVGDTIIDPASDPLAIEDDYVALVEQLIGINH